MATQNFAWNPLFLQRVFNGSGKRVEADCIKMYETQHHTNRGWRTQNGKISPFEDTTHVGYATLDFVCNEIGLVLFIRK